MNKERIKMIRAIGLAAILMATPAMGQSLCPEEFQPDRMPHPAWFEQPLITKNYKFVEMPLKDLAAFMKPTFGAGGLGLTECALDNSWCLVFIPNDVPPLCHDMILTHEIAHLHGWPANHPDGPPKR